MKILDFFKIKNVYLSLISQSLSLSKGKRDAWSVWKRYGLVEKRAQTGSQETWILVTALAIWTLTNQLFELYQ